MKMPNAVHSQAHSEAEEQAREEITEPVAYQPVTELGGVTYSLKSAHAATTVGSDLPYRGLISHLCKILQGPHVPPALSPRSHI
jgi:hypothetical protein